MANIQQSIQDITGFTEKEGKIYLSLLEIGLGSVIDISKKSGLKRTTVYNLLPSMVQSGYVRTTTQKNKAVFFIEDTRTLAKKLDERENLLASILPQLQAMHNISPLKPKITYYEGFEGMKEMYMDTISTCDPGDEILDFMGIKDFYKLFTREFAEYYIGERLKKKLRVRMISPRFPESIEALKVQEKQLRKAKIVDSDELGYKADMEIYKNKVALVSYQENFMGVIIESKQIADMMRASFEIMWMSLPEPTKYL
jgi:sugar-specific transcriptional regulator TrmB